MKRIFTLFALSLMCILQTHASVTITDTITASCNNSGVVKLGASGGTAPYRFKIYLGAYQTSGVFSGLGYGQYTFYVQDAAGLLDSTTLTVASTFTATASYNLAQNIMTGSATGGTAPYTYFWSGFYDNAFTDSTVVHSVNYQPIDPGIYLFQAKDNNGCIAATTVTATPYVADCGLSVFIKPGSSCYTQQDDSIVLAGYGGNTYALGSTLIAGYFAQNVFSFTGEGYSLAVVNDNSSSEFYATWYHYYEPAPLQLKATVNHASGAQQQNGSVSLEVWGGLGGYSYRWSNGSSSATVSGLAPGSYTVTVSESGGCSVTSSFIVGPPVLSQTSVNATCNGVSDGQVNLAVLGAYSPYVFNISGSAPVAGSNFSNLAAGAYTFYVTDSTGAQDSVTATITQPAALVINATVQNADTGVNNGFISLSVSGGTPSYQYSWSISGGTQNYLSGLYPGIYTVTVTDAQNCTATATYNIVLAGIDELTASHLSLQPNPTSGVITVTGLTENQSLVVYDAAGRLVQHVSATGSQQTINLGNQASGVYLVRLVNANGKCTAQGKVIKQ